MDNSKKNDEQNKLLTPHEIYSLKAELATAKMPDFPKDDSDCIEHDLILKIDENCNPKIYSDSEDCLKAKIEKDKDFYKIHISCEKSKRSKINFGESYERFDKDELSKLVANVELPKHFKPDWLDLNYAPIHISHRNTKLLKGLKCGQTFPFSMVEREELMNSMTYPWCTIGKIFVGKGTNFDNPVWVGSGAMVGRNLLLTASHVAPWGASPWWMRFVPAYNNGSEPFGRVYVQSYRGIKNTNDVTGLDYVICKLYEPMGDKVGWMGTQSFGDDDKYYEGNWTSVGYPGNFSMGQLPTVENNVRIEDVDNDDNGRELESRVFSSPGWSGGPLWGWIDSSPKVIGVLSGRETDFSFWDFFTERSSVSAGGRSMVDLVKYGIANWAI